MRLVDWRTRPADELTRCYAAERASWTARFAWDTTENWRQVEHARTRGSLPGLVALHGDHPAGWTFFLKHRRTLQLGAVSLATEAGASGPTSPWPRSVVDALLTGAFDSAEARECEDVMTFTPDVGDGLAAALDQRGFSHRSFEYLWRPLEPCTAGGGTEGVKSYHAGRLMAMADLLARAYPAADPARPFAPHGLTGEWVEYTSQLVAQNGCGTLLPWASVIEEDPHQGGRLIGGVIATRIADRSAHLAQVAIDPAFQGRGKGAHLVQLVLARLAGRGYQRVSLLVARQNTAARALYARLGFTPCGQFISAWCGRPPSALVAAAPSGVVGAPLP